MPTQYAHDVADGQGILIFLKLLIRWKGSLYKLLWVDLIVYISTFYGIQAIYRFALDFDQQKNFEEIMGYCEKMKTTIPLSFLLGFFVAGVVGRWWQMYMGIPWLNRVTFMADGIIIGKSPVESTKLKTTLMRYLILSWILLMRKISKQIEQRFCYQGHKADDQSVRQMLKNFNQDKKIQSTFRKLITDSEIRAFENIATQNYARTETQYVPEYWIPLQWASRLLQKALMNGYIVDIRTTLKLIDELDKLRGQMQNLRLLCSIMIPLVYTQVVIIAVYSYFLCQLFAAQFGKYGQQKSLSNSQPTEALATAKSAVSSTAENGTTWNSSTISYNVDIIFFPMFTVFQFLFIMGWLKVAICLLNPFGNGEEDFQTSEILDLNIDVCWRSGCALEDNYPDLLSPPLFNFKVTAPSNDTLHRFVALTEEDLSEVEPPPDKSFASFEFSSGTSRLRDIFCCNRKKDTWDLKQDSPSIPDDLVFQYTNQRTTEKVVNHHLWRDRRLPVLMEESQFPSMPAINKNIKENQRKHSNSSVY